MSGRGSPAAPRSSRWCVWRVGPEPFVVAVRSTGPAALVAALVITALTTVCCAWRWRVVARGLGVEVPLRDRGGGVLPLAVPQRHAARRGARRRAPGGPARDAAGRADRAASSARPCRSPPPAWSCSSVRAPWAAAVVGASASLLLALVPVAAGRSSASRARRRPATCSLPGRGAAAVPTPSLLRAGAAGPARAARGRDPAQRRRLGSARGRGRLGVRRGRPRGGAGRDRRGRCTACWRWSRPCPAAYSLAREGGGRGRAPVHAAELRHVARRLPRRRCDRRPAPPTPPTSTASTT